MKNTQIRPALRSLRSPLPLLLSFGAWALLAPPTPLGTSLPPVSEWRVVSKHKDSAACEQRRTQLKALARQTVTNNPNAPALRVAAALGEIQARCAEFPDKTDAAPAAPAAPAAAPAPASVSASPK